MAKFTVKLETRSVAAPLPSVPQVFSTFVMTLVAFFSVSVLISMDPSLKRAALLLPVGLVVGVATGWRVAGVGAGAGYRQMISRGVRTAVIWTLWMLAFLGFRAMLKRSGHGFYSDPLAAIVDVIPLAVNIAGDLVRPDLCALVFLGGLLSATIADWAARRWS